MTLNTSKKIEFPEIHDAEVDPLSRLLREDIYVKLNLPRPSEFKIDKLRLSVEKMSPAERVQVLENAKTLQTYSQAMIKTIESL